MEFIVTFVINADGPEAAAGEVEGWQVSPGAHLTSIISAQPIVVLARQVHIEDGVVPKLAVMPPEEQPKVIEPPLEPAPVLMPGLHRPLVGLGDHVTNEELEALQERGDG